MKKCLCVLLTVLLLASLLPTLALAEDTPEIPEGYTPIYTKDDLDNIRLDLSGKYILMNDIVFTEEDYAPGGDFYNSGKGWVPIGNDRNHFCGTFDGNEHVIYNLRINDSGNPNQGLFGYIGESDASSFISNLVLSNVMIIGSYGVGGIAGYSYGYCRITNCDVYGKIGGSSEVGGIIGFSVGDILRCNNFAQVTGQRTVGGIAGVCTMTGNVTSRAIQECVNYGYVHSSEGIAAGIAGGVVSQMTQFSIIKNCYNCGTIISDIAENSFGICNAYDKRGISNNYSIGTSYNGAYGHMSYFLDESVDESQRQKEGCRSIDQMKKQSNYEDWDFYTIWTIDKNAEYPFPTLRENPRPVEPKLPCNHENTELQNAANATCTEAGYTGDVVCLDCGETVEAGETIDALGHDYVDHPAQAPTCISVGWEAYQTCTRCDYTNYAEKSVDPENHVNTQNVPETASTCIARGYTAGVYCNDCKQYISGHAEKTLAEHVWNNGEVLRAATCNQKGLVKYTCTADGCGETKTEETATAPNNHNYVSAVVAPTCTAQGYTAYTCTRCGDNYKDNYKAALGHADNNGDGYCDNGCGTQLTPTNPGRPSSSDKTCAYCGKVHPNNIIGMITSFFHSIAYIFARIFGTR